MTARIVKLTRGQAIVEIDGEQFNVNGEGLGDGTWEVLPLMVYERGADDRWILIQDNERRRAIVDALQACWPGNSGGWPVLVVADHEKYDRPFILPYDVLRRVMKYFPDPDDAAKVRDALESLDCPESERVARCVLHLSAGSVAAVMRNVETALRDYRDAIFFAEYDRNDRRLHDFSIPFQD